jgi:hypothetical protein
MALPKGLAGSNREPDNISDRNFDPNFPFDDGWRIHLPESRK